MAHFKFCKIATVLVLLALTKQGYQFKVDLEGKYDFDYQLSPDQSKVIFELTVQNIGYIGLGINPKGVMDGADIFAVEVRDNGNGAEIRDCYSVGHNPTNCDEGTNDLELLGFTQNGDTTFVRFSKPVAVCNSVQDQPIQEDGETVFIWAYAPTPNMSYHFTNRGSFGVDVFSTSPSFQIHPVD